MQIIRRKAVCKKLVGINPSTLAHLILLIVAHSEELLWTKSAD